jgi:hypothetical protein
MPHAHGGAGENPEEIRAYADAWCRGGRPLAEIRRCTRRGRQIEARYLAASPVVRAELCFTRASGRWQDRLWESQPAVVEPHSSRVRAELPEGARVWFLNLVDDRDRVVSTEHAEL